MGPSIVVVWCSFVGRCLCIGKTRPQRGHRRRSRRHPIKIKEMKQEGEREREDLEDERSEWNQVGSENYFLTGIRSRKMMRMFKRFFLRCSRACYGFSETSWRLFKESIVRFSTFLELDENEFESKRALPAKRYGDLGNIFINTFTETLSIEL